jgi:hypothetical protein
MLEGRWGGIVISTGAIRFPIAMSEAPCAMAGMVAAVNVAGTEIKIAAAIEAAAHTLQLFAFACVMVCSFPNSGIIDGCVVTEPREYGRKRPHATGAASENSNHC